MIKRTIYTNARQDSPAKSAKDCGKWLCLDRRMNRKIIIIIYFVILFFRCVNPQSEIHNKKIRLTDLFTQKNVYTYIPKNIDNLDSIHGFRGVKINLKEIDLIYDDWRVKDYREKNLKVLENRSSFETNLGLLNNVNLYFYKGELKYIKLHFKGSSIVGIKKILTDAFGPPQDSTFKSDISFDIREESDKNQSKDTTQKKEIRLLPYWLPFTFYFDCSWKTNIIHLYYNEIIHRHKDKVSNATLIYVDPNYTMLPQIVDEIEKGKFEEQLEKKSEKTLKENLNKL
jgi:hypothetical protein